jgi:hypothetical protein
MGQEDHIRSLLEDPALALRQWYVSVTPTKDPDLVLTGGAGPSERRLREIFDAWLMRRREDLKVVICERLNYAKLSGDATTFGQIGLIAAVSSALSTSPWGSQIDPIATAVILVSTHALNSLCGDDNES